MKTLQFTLSVWLSMALLSSVSLSACAQSTTSAATSSVTATSDPAKEPLLKPMQQMASRLKNLAASGDPDFDYALQAKVHTQGTLDLLKAEAQSGKDTALMQMAKDLTAPTQADMDLINNTMRQIKPSRPNQGFTQKQSQNIEAIMLKVQQAASANDKLTSNLDKNFSTLLMEQRQDAIDLANTYLQFGKNETLRSYAQKLIDKSKADMEKLKAMPK
jgi:uncharacterized protein (DUF305 family)